jgi:hypothetical protein
MNQIITKVTTEGQRLAFVKKVFKGGHIDGKKANIAVVCPMCKAFKGTSYTKQKLSIKISNPNIINCWVCGYKSKNLFHIIQKYHPEHLEEYKEYFLNAHELNCILLDEKTLKVEKEKIVTLPNGFRLLVELLNEMEQMDNLSKNYVLDALNYLKSRNITTKRELWYWKLGITFDEETGALYRIIIPSFDKNGKLNYWTGRSWLKKSKKYQNPGTNRRSVIFNEMNLDWNRPLTIIEGPFDLLHANQNAVPMLGSDLTLEYQLLQEIVKNKTPTILAFDPEQEAQEKQFVLANRLLEFDISVKILEYKNITKDIGDMNKEEFSTLLLSAKNYSNEYELRRKIRSIL